MVELLIVFVSRFLFVFLLGVQTVNIVRGSWVVAFFVSVLIGVCEFTVLTYVITAIQNDTGYTIIATAILGGSTGISASVLTMRRGK